MAGVIGQVLPVGTFYSPWFRSAGNGAEMTLDIIAINGSGADITVTVQTKNSEQSDLQALNGTNPTWSNTAQTSTGQTTWTAGAIVGDGTNAGLLELVRFEYVVTGSDGWSNVFFRMLNPSWYSY